MRKRINMNSLEAQHLIRFRKVAMVITRLQSKMGICPIAADDTRREFRSDGLDKARSPVLDWTKGWEEGVAIGCR